MKKLLLPTLIIAIVLLSNCTKTENDITRINCDGIITDTASTGDSAKIFMPNVYTPNGDGLNDTIRPYTKYISAIDFTIYDDQNNIIFNTTQLGKGWTGISPITSGNIYYYRIQATTLNNNHIGKCGGFLQLLCKPEKTEPLYFEDQLTEYGFTTATSDSLPRCP